MLDKICSGCKESGDMCVFCQKVQAETAWAVVDWLEYIKKHTRSKKGMRVSKEAIQARWLILDIKRKLILKLKKEGIERPKC